jgi:hypothetical protein
MAQTTEGDTTAADNVHPFPGAAPEPQPRPKARSRDRRAAARQAAVARTDIVQSGVTSVTPSRGTLAPQRAVEHAPQRHPRYASIPLAMIAYGFFALGVSINIWNAWNAGRSPT